MKNKYLVGAFALSVAFVSCLSSQTANAAGLYFSERGVRPLGRGGAFVAGADDLSAIWYNPAGLADAGNSFFVDLSGMNFRSTYQRQALVNDPSTGEQRIVGAEYFPEVNGKTPLLPLPTLAVSNNFGLEKWNFAFGLYAPYATLTTYPENPVLFKGRYVPPPQRYSLITLDGSALITLGLYASFKPTSRVQFGAGFELLTGTFASRLAFNACPPDRLLCASESPDYDVYTQLKVGPIFAPSGTLGVQAIAMESKEMAVHLGASFHLPYWIQSPAKTQLRLPNAAVFQNARVEGDEAKVSFRLPFIARAGVETRLGQERRTRLELAFVFEGWAIHDKISIDPAGSGIRLRNVTGFPDPYEVASLEQTRGFRDTFSIRGGAEHMLKAGAYEIALRLGALYERSAIPPEYLTVLTLDFDKIQMGLGASLYLGEKKNVRIDAMFSNTFAFAVDADPRASRVGRVKVVRANDPADIDTVKINGGSYSASAQLFGLGLNWKY